MDDPQCSSISSVVEMSWCMQVENSVSKKDLSNTRRSFSPSLQIRHCGVTHRLKKKYIRHGNDAVYLLRSSLFKVFSTLVIFLKTEVWLSRAWSFLS